MQSLLSVLEGPFASPQDQLLAWVSALDVAIRAEYARGEFESTAVQTLARSVVVVGPALAESAGVPTVAATLHAARRFVEDPSERNHEIYVQRSTESFPFGPGDGCLRIDDRECGVPGSGCVSGAGTLVQVAHVLGAATVVELLRAELVGGGRAPAT